MAGSSMVTWAAGTMTPFWSTTVRTTSFWVCADEVFGWARDLGGRGFAGGEQYSECNDSMLQAWHAIGIR